MMSVVVGNEEIDQLLMAIHDGEISPEDVLKVYDQKKIETWDLRRPPAFSKEVVRTVSMITETFAVAWEDRLQQQLLVPVQILVSGVNESRMTEVIRELPDGQAVTLVKVEDKLPMFAWHCDSGLAAQLVHRMLGQIGSSEALGKNPTRTELGLLRVILQDALKLHDEAWGRDSNDPSQAAFVSDWASWGFVVGMFDPVLQVTFDYQIAGQVGTMAIHYPRRLIEELIKPFQGAEETEPPYEPHVRLGEILGTLECPVVLLEPGPELSVIDLASLKLGDKLELTPLPVTRLSIEVGSKPLGLFLYPEHVARTPLTLQKVHVTDEGSVLRSLAKRARELQRPLPMNKTKFMSFVARRPDGALDFHAVSRKGLGLLLASESPPVVAAVLASLPLEEANELLKNLPDELRSDTQGCLTTLGPASTAVVEEMKRLLAHRMLAPEETITWG